MEFLKILKNKMKFIKKFICFFKGHKFKLKQKIDWEDFAKMICSRCNFEIDEKVPSIVRIKKNQCGMLTLEYITYKTIAVGSGKSIGLGSGGSCYGSTLVAKVNAIDGKEGDSK